MKKGFKMAEENRDTAASTQPASSSETEHACNCGCGVVDDAIDMMPDEELLYDLAEEIGATQSAVSHQLRTLKQSRLVRAKRDGKNVIYSLSDDHVHTMLAQGMTHICE